MFDVPFGGIHCAYFYPQACLLLRDKMAVFQGTCHPLQCNVVGCKWNCSKVLTNQGVCKQFLIIF